jgi:hypothetical protein
MGWGKWTGNLDHYLEGEEEEEEEKEIFTIKSLAALQCVVR